MLKLWNQQIYTKWKKKFQLLKQTNMQTFDDTYSWLYIAIKPTNDCY